MTINQRALLYSAFPHRLHTRLTLPGLVAVGVSTRFQPLQECPRALPEVVPQREHLFAAVQVAADQLWPRALPVVAPQREHFLAEVQVAEE